METESTLARVRKARHEISAELGHDPQRLIEHYISLQQQHRDRLVMSPETTPKTDNEAPNDTTKIG
jgi:hypothetical protein